MAIKVHGPAYWMSGLGYDDAKKLPVIATCRRPDGYSGETAIVDIVLCEQHVVEIAPCGMYRAPVTCAADAAEVNWLIDNHPAFRNYTRV